MNCLFCSIINAEIPSDKLYEDEQCLVIRDIEPKAPFHALCLPKRHIDSAARLTSADEALVGHMFSVIARLTNEYPEGFRVVTNAGAHGCQSVGHLHFHVLAGRQLTAQMG